MGASTREAMQDIDAAIGDLAGFVEALSHSSAEQSSGVRQVSGAIVQLEQTVQQNATLVEHVAASAAMLRSRAAELERAFEVFRLEGEAHAAPRLPSR